MKVFKVFAFVVGALFAVQALAIEAPDDVTAFNIKCPARKLLPELDRAYHECANGFANGSCELFVRTFSELLPESDCQRPFDATPTKNYIVPAIWLAGDGALYDYVRLLSRLASSQDKVLTQKHFAKSIEAARRLFVTHEFRRVLDGHLGEEFVPQVEQIERELRGVVE